DARLAVGRPRFPVDHGQAPIGIELGAIGAAARDARLLGEAVGVALALVATLRVGGAHLTLRAVRVVGALALLAQLADVVRSVARDAAQARGAIAGDRAGVVALQERADERIVAVGVDEAPLRQFGQRRTVTRASHREDREDARG